MIHPIENITRIVFPEQGKYFVLAVLAVLCGPIWGCIAISALYIMHFTTNLNEAWREAKIINLCVFWGVVMNAMVFTVIILMSAL